MSNDPTVLLRQGLPGSLNIPIRKCEFYTHLPLTHVTLGKVLNLTPSYYLIKEMRRLHISHSKTFQKAKIPFIISLVPFPSKLHLINNYLCFFFLRNHIFAQFQITENNQYCHTTDLCFCQESCFHYPMLYYCGYTLCPQ